MASPLTPNDAVRLPIESPLGLFGPAHHVESQIPAPLYLLEYVPGLLDARYEAGEDGFLANKSDWYQERVLRYEDGSQCRVEVVGHPKLGLPSLYDWDYMLGLFRINDQGGVDEQGRFVDPGYRSVVRAAGRAEGGADAWKAAKRALARWGSVTVKTWTDISYVEQAEQIRLRGGYPLAPGGYPPRREIETSHHVLTYDVERYLRGDVAYDTIDELRLDPVWLDQTVAGISAWIDVDVHNGLRSPTAKALYQRLALRIARGYRQDLVVTLSDLIGQLSKTASARPAKDLSEVSRALDSLRDAGVVATHASERTGRGQYELTITPGPRLASAALLRGAGVADPAETRRLLFHLGHFGIAVATARELIRANPAQVLSVLWRAYYLEENPAPRGKGIANLGGWIVRAVREEWRFEEPEYKSWLEQMMAAARQGERPAVGHALTPAPLEPAPEPPGSPQTEPETVQPEDSLPSLPDDVWGETLARFQNRVPALTFDTWFRPTWLDRVTDGEVRVRTENSFAPGWITRWRAELEAILEEVLGRPVALVVRSGGAPDTVEADT